MTLRNNEESHTDVTESCFLFLGCNILNLRLEVYFTRESEDTFTFLYMKNKLAFDLSL